MISFDELLAAMRKYQPQMPFEANMEYAVSMQKWLSRNRVWECNDATPDEQKRKEWLDALNVYLT